MIYALNVYCNKRMHDDVISEIVSKNGVKEPVPPHLNFRLCLD